MNNWEDAQRTKYLQDHIDNTPLITQKKMKGALSILKKKLPIENENKGNQKKSIMSFLYREMETWKIWVNTTNMKRAYQVFVVGVQMRIKKFK